MPEKRRYAFVPILAALLALHCIVTAHTETPTPWPESYRIGLDPGAPISASTGDIYFNGPAIQDSGSHWVRINFILGPWTTPGDSSRHGGQNMTWFETYDHIINDAVSRGLKPYALVGLEAVHSAHEVNTDGYVADYVSNFLSIVDHFKDRIRVYESVNEPNDWAGGTSAHITPYYYAKMMEDVYRAIKIDNGHLSDPSWNSLTLVSGPLFTHDQDTGEAYFTQTWTAGKTELAWEDLKSNHGTYPFDGIGYHIYVAQGTSAPSTVEWWMNRNLDAMWNSVTTLEGTDTDKKYWVSEIGWNTASVTESAQADNVDTAINLFRADPRVIMTSWFCLRDFGSSWKWGLERSDASKKPGWYRFQTQASIVTTPTCTNTPTLTPTMTATETPTIETSTSTPTYTPTTETPTFTPTFTPTSTATPRIPDFNKDNEVDSIDLLELISEFGGNSPLYDLNDDGITDHRDAFLFMLWWSRQVDNP